MMCWLSGSSVIHWTHHGVHHPSCGSRFIRRNVNRNIFHFNVNEKRDRGRDKGKEKIIKWWSGVRRSRYIDRYCPMCQSVPEPIIQLVDSEGLQVSSDHYYRIGNSLELFCQVSRYWTKPNIFTWFRMGRPIALDLWRGGIRFPSFITIIIK